MKTIKTSLMRKPPILKCDINDKEKNTLQQLKRYKTSQLFFYKLYRNLSFVKYFLQ